MLSGLHDPTWGLDAEQSEELVRRLQPVLAQLSPSKPVLRDGLGYRGIHVFAEDDPRLPDELFASYGTLIVPRRGSTSGTSISELERWLLRTAAGRVDPHLIAAAEQELSARAST